VVIVPRVVPHLRQLGAYARGAELRRDVDPCDPVATETSGNKRIVDAGAIAMPAQRSARLAHAIGGRIDRAQPRQRAELALDEHGVHAGSLLALQLNRTERVQDVERAPESSGAPSDPLPADAHVRVCGSERHRSAIQPMPAIVGAGFGIIPVQVPVLRRRSILLQAELRGVQVVAEQYLVVVLKVSKSNAAAAGTTAPKKVPASPWNAYSSARPCDSMKGVGARLAPARPMRMMASRPMRSER